MNFTKYHGLGNDFICIDGRGASPPVTAALARRWCDRHRGIGADGVLVALPPTSPQAALTMRVFNSDGSTAEMCGNGLRCFVSHAYSRWGFSGPELVVDTLAGLHFSSGPTAQDGSTSEVEVSMGAARFVRSFAAQPMEWADDPTATALIPFGGQPAVGFGVDMGNPHVVVDWEGQALPASSGDVNTETAANPAVQWAFDVQRMDCFPQGVNVGLVQRRGPGHLSLAVIERGAGLTEACGTGACAAAAVARRRGWVQAGATAVRVDLPGGSLWIREDAEGTVWMRGPATHVFDGVIPDPSGLAD